MLNALSYIGILAALLRWRREHEKSTLPAERFFGAIRVGMRFVTHTRALQIVLIRGSAFFIFASATWSLFPLIVRQELQRGPEIYGLLLTCIGIGAVAGAILLPRVRTMVSRDTLVAGASALYALAALSLAHLPYIPLLAVAMVATGVAWISILPRAQFRPNDAARAPADSPHSWSCSWAEWPSAAFYGAGRTRIGIPRH
jgi:predicted MFS family arabinose efflux permease